MERSWCLLWLGEALHLLEMPCSKSSSKHECLSFRLLFLMSPCCAARTKPGVKDAGAGRLKPSGCWVGRHCVVSTALKLTVMRGAVWWNAVGVEEWWYQEIPLDVHWDVYLFMERVLQCVLGRETPPDYLNLLSSWDGLAVRWSSVYSKANFTSTCARGIYNSLQLHTN